MLHIRPGSSARGVVYALAGFATTLSGCASLPSSGPTAHQVLRSAQGKDAAAGMQVVDMAAPIVDQVARHDRAADALEPTIASLAAAGENDVVGPGDVLSVSIFEVGVTLFNTASPLADPNNISAQGANFPATTVARDGSITLPYAGKLMVAGRTPGEIQTLIEGAYRGKSQSPQAIVVVRNNLSQTVYVSGDVRRSGRIELSLQHERLLDAIATSGGTVTQTQDMVVHFTRGGRTVEERLDRIQAGAPDDLVLKAGDRIELIREPQTFVAFGATGKVAQVSFDQTNLTLAEAVARAGGPSDQSADPRSVFLFRYEPSATATAGPIPTIYRLDLMRPESYFLAQRFAMRDKDVVYFSNARTNSIAKFVGILNNLFSPILTAKAAGNL